MAEKVAKYEMLLNHLSTRVSKTHTQIIVSILGKYDAVDPRQDKMEFSVKDVKQVSVESGSGSDFSADAASVGALDCTDEDFIREEALATGFLGKSSEVTWLHRLGSEYLCENKPSQEDVRQTLAVTDVSYYLDDFNVTTSETIDPFRFPSSEICQQLFKAYMDKVHSTFPIVSRTNMSAQLQKFITGQAQRPPNKWLAIVNLMFAIGSKHSHLSHVGQASDQRDHLIYFTRGRLLGIDGEALFEHSDLQTIQIQGLVAFYFLCDSQINRACLISGIAIRNAIVLRLNMRNESEHLENSLKEIRYRVWWALYILEQRLCCMTGRANSIPDEYITTPLPVSIDERDFHTDLGTILLSRNHQREDLAQISNARSSSTISAPSHSISRSRPQSRHIESHLPSAMMASSMEWTKDMAPNAALCFLHLVQLTRLTQSTFRKLYSPPAVSQTWSKIQIDMRELNKQLEKWYHGLPLLFDFRHNLRYSDFYNVQLILGFFYYSTKLMIHRPCLYRLDRKIPNQSSKLDKFNHHAAVACVDAARDMIKLLPDEMNSSEAISVGPWNILPWIVQAVTVLILEISLRIQHMPEEADDVVESSKKSVRWLYMLGQGDISAARAGSLCNDLLRKALAKTGRETGGLPDYVSKPKFRVNHCDDTTGANSFASTGPELFDVSSTTVPSNTYTPTAVEAFGYGQFDLHMEYGQYFLYPSLP